MSHVPHHAENAKRNLYVMTVRKAFGKIPLISVINAVRNVMNVQVKIVSHVYLIIMLILKVSVSHNVQKERLLIRILKVVTLVQITAIPANPLKSVVSVTKATNSLIKNVLLARRVALNVQVTNAQNARKNYTFMEINVYLSVITVNLTITILWYVMTVFLGVLTVMPNNVSNALRNLA